MPVVNLTRGTWLATRVRTADGFLTRLLGLLRRTTLHSEEALWLVPCQGVHTVGMRFAIDVIFLDRGQRVVAVVPGLAPHRISPIKLSAHSVLELRRGSIGKSRTLPGDQLEISFAESVEVEDLAESPLSAAD